MWRSKVSTQRDAQRKSRCQHRRPSHGNGTSPSPGAAAAVPLDVWASTRLLDSTAHILAVQPADPLRVLSVRFSSEAVLIAPYPATPAPTEWKESDAEAKQEAIRAANATPSSGTSKAAVLNRSQPKQKLSTLTNGCGAATIPMEHLIEKKWVRQHLQPYGLRAVARCACACPPPAAPKKSFPGAMSPVASANGLDTDTTGNSYFSLGSLHSQWIDIFGLLHRQSRMSIDELTAASAHWYSQLSSAAVIPPVDHRAAEEIPASMVLLYVMVVIEEHLRPADCGEKENGTERPCQLRRRLQTSVKLLGMHLMAAFMDLQREAEGTEYCSSDAGACDRWHGEDVEMHDRNDFDPAPGDTNDCDLTRTIYLLSTQDLDQFHQWLHCRLQERSTWSLTSPTAANTTVERDKEADDIQVNSPIEYLQSRSTAYLTRVFGCPADDMAGTDSTQNVMSVETFVALMDRLSAVIVAHQHTALAMSITLYARLPPTARTSAGEDRLPPPWLIQLLCQCVEAVVAPLRNMRDSAFSSSAPSTLPLAWRVYTNQLCELLSPFHCDLLQRFPKDTQEEGTPRSTVDDGALCKLQRRLLAWAKETELRYYVHQKTSTAGNRFPGLAVVEMVSALVSHVFEAYTITLYPNWEIAMRV